MAEYFWSARIGIRVHLLNHEFEDATVLPTIVTTMNHVVYFQVWLTTV